MRTKKASPTIRPHPPWMPRGERCSVESKDGVPIAYERLGKGTEAIVLANGLGGRLYAWEPVVRALGDRYRIVTWDYRGLFDSGMPQRLHHLSVPYHAQDLAAVMDAENIERAHVLGWSMGVQVALEFAVLHPERVGKLVLINGTHGHALTTALQPIVRNSVIHRYLHELLDFVISSERSQRLLSKLLTSRLAIEAVGGTLARLRRNMRLRDMYAQYQHDVFGGSFRGFLRLFQELDAHSVYHHLRDIAHQTLLVSGALDPLTPAYQTREMLRKMPNASHLSFRLGTHFVLLEYPEVVSRAVAQFLDQEQDGVRIS